MSTISASTTSTTAFKITTDTTGALVFQTGASPTTAVTMDASQNVGIGTSSPNYKLQLTSASTDCYLQFTNSGSGSASSDGLIIGCDTSSANFIQRENLPMVFYTNNTERMRLDASGNLGLGVTPSAYNVTGFMDFIGNGAIGNATAISSNSLQITHNAYYNSGWKYKSNFGAGQYQSQGGAHYWYTAPSGTAGNAITFTQAMTLDASGNLGIGLTGIVSGWGVQPKFQIKQTSTSQAAGIVSFSSVNDNGIFIGCDSSARGVLGVSYASTGSFVPLAFEVGGAERARITTSGNFGIGTTAPGAPIQALGANTLSANTRYLKGWIGGASSWGSNAYEELGVGYSGIRSVYSGGDNWVLTFATGTSGEFNAGTQTEKARIDTTGRFTVSNQTAFSAYSPNPTNQTNIVKYVATRYNKGSAYNTTTGVFTAPIAGRYFFTFNALMTVTGDYMRLYFRVNGVANATYGDTLAGGGATAWTGWSYNSVGMSIILELAANDTVSVWNDGPSATYGNDYGTFCGYLLG